MKWKKQAQMKEKKQHTTQHPIICPKAFVSYNKYAFNDCIVTIFIGIWQLIRIHLKCNAHCIHTHTPISFNCSPTALNSPDNCVAKCPFISVAKWILLKSARDSFIWARNRQTHAHNYFFNAFVWLKTTFFFCSYSNCSLLTACLHYSFSRRSIHFISPSLFRRRVCSHWLCVVCSCLLAAPIQRLSLAMTLKYCYVRSQCRCRSVCSLYTKRRLIASISLSAALHRTK